MATIAQLKELAVHAVKGTAPAEFSVENVNAALADGIRDLACDYNNYCKNKYDIFEIIMKAADEVVPQNVIDAFGAFAEIQQVAQGTKAIFKKPKLGKARARQFLTQVGLSGVYETFRLDTDTFELGAKAIGGAVTIDFERFLDGQESLVELLDLAMTGLSEAMYGEVQRALIAAVDVPAPKRPAANKVVGSYSADALFKLITTVKAYGPNAVIFAAPEFVGAMGADVIVAPVTSGTPIVHQDDIDAIHKTGYISMFRGTPIVQIPQSFVDESNTKTWINPQFAYVLPAGKEKVVKICLEGNTQVYSRENRDQSEEVNFYKKVGVAIITHHNWGIYQNTGISAANWASDMYDI